MKRLWMLPALAALVTLAKPAHAVIDTKNANYADSYIDLTLPGTGAPIKFQRHYQSRSIFVGMLGFGWCSDYETTLEKLPEDRLKLTECGAGQEVYYSPAKFDEKSTNSVVDAIVAHYKKTNPGASQQTVETLRGQVRENADLRLEWAKSAGLKFPETKKGSVYAADNLLVEKIEFDGTYYTRTVADGTLQKFDSAGHLIFIYDRNSNYLKLSYTADKLSEIVDNAGKKLSLVFYPNSKRLKEINGPSNTKVTYKYKGEDLSEVKTMWGTTYTYEYDDTHNVTKINFPDGTFKALTYNQKNDWVTSFTDRLMDPKAKSCTERYSYEVDKEEPKNHFWTIVVKKCGTEVVNESRFEFWYKQLADGRKALSRVLTKGPTDTLDVTYHPEFGRPTIIKKNAQTTTFDYYKNGLIREKTTANVRMLYEYQNQYSKVSKVSAEFFDTKGKVARKRETTFGYDEKANLRTAQNSDGQSVKLTYDGRGRIATITDQALKEVQIKYDERTGKPAQIIRPKVGMINVAYKSTGEISQVKSNDDPAVAVQIASTFNNLLDIIAPATSELNL
jgi:YD repeat-containing protein